MPAPGCAAPRTGRTVGWRCGARRAAARPTCCTSGRSAPARHCWPAPALHGLPELPAAGVALDDADAVADERALLHLLNAAGEAGLPVLLAARAPPARWAARLPDLASRLRAMTAVEIGAPEDALLRALLARLLADRQLRLPEAGAGMAGAAPAAQRRRRCARRSRGWMPRRSTSTAISRVPFAARVLADVSGAPDEISGSDGDPSREGEALL